MNIVIKTSKDEMEKFKVGNILKIRDGILGLVIYKPDGLDLEYTCKGTAVLILNYEGMNRFYGSIAKGYFKDFECKSTLIGTIGEVKLE